VDCFASLESGQVDWTTITSDTDCDDVIGFLNDADYCSRLDGDTQGRNAFCDTFQSCIVWDDEEDDDDVAPEDEDGYVDCKALTECKWDGMKENWIGDGICHDNMHGCYNTEICGWDGGDCCEDTCDDSNSPFKACGSEPWSCKDPASEDCDSKLTTKCENDDSDSGGSSSSSGDVTCKDSEQKYRLIMYDSFGDGWDNTHLLLAEKGKTKKVFDGHLEDGSEGTEYVCLSKDPTCYHAITSGGAWGVEVGWELKTLKEGSPAIAGAGAPSDCEFPIGGAECESTCDGKPTKDPTDDPDYRTFKEMFNCIDEKCVIQLGACMADEVCEECFSEQAPAYCYGVASFSAVLDCTMCSCTDRAGSAFCNHEKPSGNVAPTPPKKDDDNSTPRKCTGQETMSGASAVLSFSECANMEEIGVMVEEFDESNFGQLDQFEACAHAFNDEDNHGGHTALSCMQILYNAMKTPVSDKNKKNPPKDAIMAMATDLYQNSASFCDCAAKANEECPLCPSFMSFKSLLFESLDACTALDEIDCDAWSEFSPRCKENLESEFKKVNLRDSDQCDYMKDGCGGAGAFPAFRRLDCDKEIDSTDWAFYKDYESKCLKGSDGDPPTRAPTPTSPTKSPTSPTRSPTRKTSSPASRPTPTPYVAADDDEVEPVPYVPSGSSSGKKSHWFRNLVVLGLLGGAGYYVYKKRFDSFNFVQYRRVRNFGNFGYDMHNDDSAGGGMYSNLNSSTTFEPPSLPPTPQMMGGQMMGGYVGATEMT